MSSLPTGICKLCEQLELDPLEDVRVLVLMWKLGANKKPAEIQKDEWVSGCRKLQLDSIDKFKALLPSLDTGFLERDEFADFFKVGLFCIRLLYYSAVLVGSISHIQPLCHER